MLMDFWPIGIVYIIHPRPFGDFLCNRLLSVDRVRVGAEEFRWSRSALRPHRLKEINHALWIEAGLVQHHRADCVCLRLVTPRVLHHQALGSHLNSHLSNLPDDSSS